MPSRCHLLAAASAGVVALAGCSGGPGAGVDDRSGSDEWPALGHDDRNTRYAPGATGPQTDPGVEWRRDIGIATGSPTVADGTVFAPVGDDILALDAAGELRWRADPKKDSAGYWSRRASTMGWPTSRATSRCVPSTSRPAKRSGR